MAKKASTRSKVLILTKKMQKVPSWAVSRRKLKTIFAFSENAQEQKSRVVVCISDPPLLQIFPVA